MRQTVVVFLDTQQLQGFISPMLENMVMHRAASSEIELSLSDFFDASAEAQDMCRQLLSNVKSTRSNYRWMDSFLAAVSDGTATASTSSSAALAPLEPSSSSFPARSNPFCTTTRSDFRQIHDRCSSILQSIRSSHGRVSRKLKVVKAVKKLSRALLVMACGAAAIGAGAHLLLLGLLIVGPAAAGLCFCKVALKRPRFTATARATKNEPSGKTTSSLSHLRDLLDTAAKGTYVLGGDLDTLNQLVARLSDGIERENAMARWCMEKASDRWPAAVQEMVSELKRSCSTSWSLTEELEEHVCLCLAIIQKARVLVLQAMSMQA